MRRYEGDGQLAYMARRGDVDYVLTPDSDLIVHRVPRVMLTPPPGSGSRLDFTSGDIVYYIPCAEIAKRCSPANAKKLGAWNLKKATQVKWLLGCIQKHGLEILQTLGVVVGCDYSGSGFPGVALGKALPVLYEHGCDVETVVNALWAKHRPTPPRAKRRRGGASAPPVAPVASTGVTVGSPAHKEQLLTLLKGAALCFEHALAYDADQRKVVEISGTLDANQLADLANLVGVVPPPEIAEKIALGMVSARVNEEGGYDELEDCADMRGA